MNRIYLFQYRLTSIMSKVKSTSRRACHVQFSHMCIQQRQWKQAAPDSLENPISYQTSLSLCSLEPYSCTLLDNMLQRQEKQLQIHLPRSSLALIWVSQFRAICFLQWNVILELTRSRDILSALIKCQQQFVQEKLDTLFKKMHITEAIQETSLNKDMFTSQNLESPETCGSKYRIYSGTTDTCRLIHLRQHDESAACMNHVSGT